MARRVVVIIPFCKIKMNELMNDVYFSRVAHSAKAGIPRGPASLTSYI